MRISYVVVTGFLGSGKTTLLRRIARDASAHNKRVAFIVNDLAEIDVDGATLDAERGELSTVVRLSSGCICCTIRGEFEAAVTQIVEQFAPEMIVVESSGVTNPRTVLHGLNHPQLRLDSVITVVDAERFMDYARHSTAVETQVYMADFILINKRELVTNAQLQHVTAQVRRFNNRCAIIPCSYADVSLDALLGAQGLHADDELQQTAGEPHDHLHEDDIETLVVPVPKPLSPERLTAFLKSDVVNGVYRAKGFVQVDGEPGLALFNYVPRRFGLEQGVATQLHAGEGFIVFIGRALAKAELSEIGR